MVARGPDRLGLLPLTGPRVHAGAGRGQPAGSAARSRSTSRWTRSPTDARRCAADHAAVPGGRSRSCRRSAGPTTAPTRPASTTSNSSSRLRPRDDWPGQPTGRRVAGARTEAAGTDRGDERRAAAASSSASTGTSRRYIRDNVMESLSGVKGENSVKIIGPDLDELEQLAERGQDTAGATVPGIENVGIFRIKGQIEPGIPGRPRQSASLGRQRRRRRRRDPDRRRRQDCSQMIEGEKTFDITAAAGRRQLRGRRDRRSSTSRSTWSNNTVSPPGRRARWPTPVTGAATGHCCRAVRTSAAGSDQRQRNVGTVDDPSPAAPPAGATSSRRVNEQGQPDPKGTFCGPAPRRSTASRASG